jgi:hypothetical protein
MIAGHTLELTDGVNKITFDVIAHAEDADYSWSAEAVLQRRPDGALFYFKDGGCSCNSFADDATVADLKPIHSFSEALALTSDRASLQKSYDLGAVEYR